MTETKPFTGRSHTLYDSHAGQGKSISSVAAPVQSEAPAKLGFNLRAERVLGNFNFGDGSKNEGSTYTGVNTSSDVNKPTTVPGAGSDSDNNTVAFNRFDGNFNIGKNQDNQGCKYQG